MHVITYDGKPAAVVFAGRICLLGWIAVLEVEHPIRRWVTCKALFAQDVLEGLLPPPATDLRAERFARAALMPDPEFLRVEAADDHLVAEHFNVPLAPVREKRLDLLISERRPARAWWG
jgi:hypothetical protein